jgi:hypothetical protein
LGGIFPHRSFLLVDCVVNRTRKSKLFTIGRNRAGQLLSVCLSSGVTSPELEVAYSSID